MRKLYEPMFRVGDLVRWTSQSQGFATTKEGKIAAVVPAGRPPQHYVHIPYKLRMPGGPRNHESYLVHAKGHGSYLLWPRVKDLVLLWQAQERKGGSEA